MFGYKPGKREIWDNSSHADSVEAMAELDRLQADAMRSKQRQAYIQIQQDKAQAVRDAILAKAQLRQAMAYGRRKVRK